MPYSGKPIIGIAGGIGSGKSFVSKVLAEMGCHVIDSDAQARAAYDDPQIRRQLVEWWGPGVLKPDGQVDRKAVGKKVFSDPAQRLRLEQLLHPIIAATRDREMARMAHVKDVFAFVWDAPLLFEAGLDWSCDAVIFVDTPLDERIWRVGKTRGWDREELILRENSQMPLDRKRDLSDYVLTNTADAASIRDQVRELLPHILAAS